MVHIEKTVMVPYSAEQMFALVDTVERYPEFLPWCSRSEVLKREENILEATVYMDYMKIHQSFSTHNENTPPHHISMTLLQGPFTALNGVWQFTPLGEKICKVHFTLDYDFSNALLAKVIGPVFSMISGNLVSSFVKEAKRRYGGH
ncbi:MAG: type II toxin-antitoxin system RatA family toxin [Neisseriaceae bacterium]|nr:type II toxin-antitoxin system RatA family toxin [Neisseriaceae bacterium]MBQ9619375.1 type II toxin-antitoxin system RatA family toxin [Neisseriaceae bacterium]